MKEFVRVFCTTLEGILTSKGLWKPHRTYATSEDQEEAQTRTLSIAIRELIRKKLTG